MTFTQGENPYKTMEIGRYKNGFYRFPSVSFDFNEKIITINNQIKQINIVYDIWNNWCESLIDKYNSNDFYKNQDGVYIYYWNGKLNINEYLILELKYDNILDNQSHNIFGDYTLLFNNINNWKIFIDDMQNIEFRGGRFEIENNKRK